MAKIGTKVAEVVVVGGSGGGVNTKKIVGETIGVNGGEIRGGCPIVASRNAVTNGHATKNPITSTKIKRFRVIEHPLKYLTEGIVYRAVDIKSVQ